MKEIPLTDDQIREFRKAQKPDGEYLVQWGLAVGEPDKFHGFPISRVLFPVIDLSGSADDILCAIRRWDIWTTPPKMVWA